MMRFRLDVRLMGERPALRPRSIAATATACGSMPRSWSTTLGNPDRPHVPARRG
jgi:hypothetical protein